MGADLSVCGFLEVNLLICRWIPSLGDSVAAVVVVVGYEV